MGRKGICTAEDQERIMKENGMSWEPEKRGGEQMAKMPEKFIKDICEQIKYELNTRNIVEVVKCENCEHWKPEPDGKAKDGTRLGKCYKFRSAVSYGQPASMWSDDYCSYGEAKDNA